MFCLVLTVCTLLSVRNADAVPASPESREMAQPDGTRFQLQLRGDEFFSWTETSDGYAVMKDSADGFWKFARPASDRAAFVALPAARVGSVDPETHGVRKNALPDRIFLRKQVHERQRTIRGEPVELALPAAADGGATSTTAEPPPEQPPARIPVSGTKTIRNIVILASFSDHWDAGSGTVLSSKGRVSVGEYSNLFNEVNHAADGAVGSVQDYYKEVSYGKLTVDSAVTPWVVLPQNEAYYGANVSGSDANPKQMVLDAINAADAAGFDFSQGDSDGDGWADGLTIIHSGHGEEYTGNPANCIWSHQWTTASIVAKDGVNMYRYHTEPALRGLTTSTSITRIGVICHEMGHFFGLPDLYDYSGTTLGIGRWGVMGTGSWNGSDGKRPAHFCAWSKCMLGFANPVPIHTQAGLSQARVEDNAEVKLVRDGMSNGEYFLVENRARLGFDNDSAAIFPGMVIYHVDSKSANNDLGTWAHPVVKIEEADGDNSLGAKTAYSEAGDVWTSASGLAGGFRDQTGIQSANAMRYQASFYNRTDNPSNYTCNIVSNFSAAGSPMTFNVKTVKTAVSNQAAASPAYTVSWAAASQAVKYELQEGVRATLTSFADGAEDEDAMYDNWFLSGSVQRDTGGKKAGSYSYAMHQYYGGKFYSSMQALTLRKPFKVMAGTTISFWMQSHLGTGYGYLKCQISSDGGNTWKTLGTYSGYTPSTWQSKSFDFAAINAQGVNEGDLCSVRFVSNFEYPSGLSSFPGYGFALDSIAITGTEIEGYGGWTTLDNAITNTSYGLSGKTNGVNAYRVSAFANGIWQGFGPEGETVVSQVPSIASISSTNADGAYGPGSAIDITLAFSEPVTLSGGNLVVTLETGATDREVVIGPFSIAGAVSGVYTVQAEDASADLSVKAIGLSGATLRNAGGTDADVSVPSGHNLDDNKTIIIRSTLTLTAGKTGDGAISPEGAVVVERGGSTNFAMTANAGNHIASIRTNGIHVAGSPYSGNGFTGTNFFWGNIFADGTITVAFVLNTFPFTVVSERGVSTPPAGTNWFSFGAVVTNQMGSPLVQGTTQYVCRGATVAGNTYTQVSPILVTLTLTNSATLTWAWDTNVLFTCEPDANGLVSGRSNGWYALGSSVTVTAAPSLYYHFAPWSGDMYAFQTKLNPLTLAMNRARAIQAHFDPDLATNQTPAWWLAQYGLPTNDIGALFEEGDGLPAWAEYVAGTDPTNPSSVFEISGFTGGNGEGHVLSWKSVSGRVYSIWSASNLSAGFQPLATGIPAGSGFNVWTDSVPPDVLQRFYRLTVTNAP